LRRSSWLERQAGKELVLGMEMDTDRLNAEVAKWQAEASKWQGDASK